MKIQVSPAALAQLTELMHWWDRNRPAARVRVEGAFEAALDTITSHPKLGRVYPENSRYRTWPLKGTPYYVLYRVDEAAGVIRIGAVWSTARGEGPPL